MTALDDYLAKQRETLRAATPRPWTNLSPNLHPVISRRPDQQSYEAVVNLAQGTSEGMAPRNARLIVSAVNDREALLDAAEVLARIVAANNEHGLPEPSCSLCGYSALMVDAQAVLSRLTADSPTGWERERCS